VDVTLFGTPRFPGLRYRPLPDSGTRCLLVGRTHLTLHPTYPPFCTLVPHGAFLRTARLLRCYIHTPATRDHLPYPTPCPTICWPTITELFQPSPRTTLLPFASYSLPRHATTTFRLHRYWFPAYAPAGGYLRTTVRWWTGLRFGRVLPAGALPAPPAGQRVIPLRFSHGLPPDASTGCPPPDCCYWIFFAFAVNTTRRFGWAVRPGTLVPDHHGGGDHPRTFVVVDAHHQRTGLPFAVNFGPGDRRETSHSLAVTGGYTTGRYNTPHHTTLFGPPATTPSGTFRTSGDDEYTLFVGIARLKVELDSPWTGLTFGLTYLERCWRSSPVCSVCLTVPSP